MGEWHSKRVLDKSIEEWTEEREAYCGEEEEEWEPPIAWGDAETSWEEWEVFYAEVPNQSGKAGRPRKKEQDFLIINAILWVLATGAQWRRIPKMYGSWSSAYSRFNRWTKAGIWDGILRAVQAAKDAAGALDWGVHHVDSTVARAHQDSAGAARQASGLSVKESQKEQALGRSRGGLSTKVHMRVEGAGKPVVIILTPGQQHDITQFEPLMDSGHIPQPTGRPKLRPKRIAADKAYGSKKNRKFCRTKRIIVVIPSKKNQKRRHFYDKKAYKKRNHVERAFCWLKRYRRLATRYDKLDDTFRAFWVIGALRMWIRDPFAA